MDGSQCVFGLTARRVDGLFNVSSGLNVTHNDRMTSTRVAHIALRPYNAHSVRYIGCVFRLRARQGSYGVFSIYIWCGVFHDEIPCAVCVCSCVL